MSSPPHTSSPVVLSHLTLDSDLLWEAEHRGSADLSFSSFDILASDSVVKSCRVPSAPQEAPPDPHRRGTTVLPSAGIQKALGHRNPELSRRAPPEERQADSLGPPPGLHTHGRAVMGCSCLHVINVSRGLIIINKLWWRGRGGCPITSQQALEVGQEGASPSILGRAGP